jgi:hypothetical protein
MTDCALPFENLHEKSLITKNISNKSHPFVYIEMVPLSVFDEFTCYNTRSFLSSMLEGEKSVVRHRRSLRMAVDAEDRAIAMRLVKLEVASRAVHSIHF